MAAVFSLQTNTVVVIEDAPEEITPRCPVEFALSIPLILDKILQHLPTRDLLATSAVNCSWNARSRVILRDLKKCFARTDCGVPTCAHLIPWYIQVSKMSIPFNGLSIRFDNREIHNSDCCSDQVIQEEFFHTEWALKYLHIAGIQSYCPPHCAAVRFIKRVLATKSLTELEITHWNSSGYARDPWRMIFDSELELPFKIAKIPKDWFTNPLFVLRQFIILSPNLVELDCYVTPKNIVTCNSANRYGMFKKLKFHVTSQSDFLACDKFSQSGPQLVGLNVEGRLSPSKDRENLPWISLQRMFMSSSKSLRSLEVTIPIFIKLAELITVPLFNVTEFTIDFSGFYEEREAFVALQKFNFSQFCPKLTSIAAKATRTAMIYTMTASEYERNSSHSAHLSANINHVRIQGQTCLFARCFVRSFPKITAVELSHGRASCESFREICRHWVSLREIKIGSRLEWSSGSLDAAFCGIRQSEVVELQRRGSGFLEKFNIVPNYPALRDLKHLSQLKLSKELLCADKETGSTVTPVTKLLTFRHLRNVKISYFED